MSERSTDDAGAAKGSLRACLNGLILSLALTALSFSLVASGALPRVAMLFGLSALAILQILVHLHYFLHLDASSSARWNLLALAFTVLIMFIFVGGSIWIMFNLNYRMM